MADYTLSAKITGDSSGFDRAIAKAKKTVSGFGKDASQEMDKASKSTGKSLAQIAEESGKTVNQLKSDVMKAAAEYQKAGMTQSEAMKKAYADIGYSAGEAENKSKAAIGGIGVTIDSIAQKAVAAGDKIKSIGGKITSVGDSLTNKITKPALAAGTALAGITIAKGFGRLVGIDDARAKLQGLGHDAQTIETIMDSALTSVKGTSFGLDEAATTAANAVAAGIKPGQELTKYLSMTADAAAIAGTSMSEMGSIINKVQTGQTVYTEDLEQLADRGLPVYQWLAEEAGVAASEVKQLASDGQISSQMLYSAIEKNIGGAAQIMGETSFSAGLANIGASISRIGANFLDAGGQGGGFFSQLKPLMAEFSESLGALETRASELGVKFGSAFSDIVQRVRDLKSNFDALPASVQSTIGKAVGIGSAIAVGIGPALKIIGPMVTGFGALGKVIAAVASPVGLVVTAIAALAAGFAYLMQTNEGFRNTVMSVVNAVLPGIQDLISVIGSNLIPLFSVLQSTVGGIISGLLPGIQSAIASLIPVIVQVVSTVTDLAAAVLPTVISVISQLAPFLVQIAQTLGQLYAALAPIIAQLISALLPAISSIITVIANVVSTVMPALVAILNVIMSVIQTLIPIITNILSVVISVVANIISAITPIISFIGLVITNIMAIITPIVTFVANTIALIVQIIGTLIGSISGIFSTIFGVVSSTWTSITSAVSGAISTIASVVSTLSSTFSGIFNRIYSIVSSVMGRVRSYITNVFSAIRSAWSGLTGFVSGVFSGVAGAVQQLVSQVKGFVNGVIGGINAAIGLINKIPGVSISRIPQLASGTDNWQGGFAYMNEGGRGELTYLPNGSQVIPHDISVKYAKEAARSNTASATLDMTALGDYIIAAMSEVGARQGESLEKGISKMGVYFDNRQVGRVFDKMGYVRG